MGNILSRLDEAELRASMEDPALRLYQAVHRQASVNTTSRYLVQLLRAQRKLAASAIAKARRVKARKAKAPKAKYHRR